MNWADVQKYLGLERDFSFHQREAIDRGYDDAKEYFFSIDNEKFKFPFSNTNFYSLKTDFSTPMNVLIARIIQRSNPKISYLLSLINKTIKNEVDRHPIKLSKFYGEPTCWNLTIFLRKSKSDEVYRLFWDNRHDDAKYFDALKRRKIIAEKHRISFGNQEIKYSYDECSSPDFPISKNIVVDFYSKTYKEMYKFDTTKYYCTSISYSFSYEREIDFEEINNHLTAKDLAKKIILEIPDVFKFTSYSFDTLKFYKKSNASKFYKIEIFLREYLGPKFKEFVMRYMKDDGIIYTSHIIQGIPVQSAKEGKYYSYPVSVYKKFMKDIYNNTSS